MTPRSRTAPHWLQLTVALAVGIGLSCGQPAADDAPGEAREERQLRQLSLPDLSAFPSAVREQLATRRARLQALAEAGEADREALGEAYGLMGQLLLAYGLDYAAEPALLNAADLLPEDTRWPYYLGHLYQQRGEPERARRQLERVLDLQPDYVPAHTRLAVVYRELGRDSDARSLLREALRIDPQNAVAHFLLGHLVVAENPSRAIEHYETALRLQPDASIVHYPLAMAYRKLGEVDRSRELLARRGRIPVRSHDPLIERLAELRKGAGAGIARGNELAAQGQYRQAADLFEAAAREDSTNVSAYLNLGVAAAQLGQFARATGALERALRLDPSNSQAHYSMALVLLLSNAPDGGAKAMEHLRAALATDPGHTAARAALADLLWRSARCREAIAQFDSVLSSTPHDPKARIRQAVCHAHLGEYARARAVLEAGHQAVPDDPRLQNALARILAASPDFAVRDGSRALALAEPLVAAYRSPDTLETLAMAYGELGDFEQAIRYQTEAIGEAERRNLPAGRLDYMRSVLSRYEAGQPNRSPWRPDVFGE